MEAKGWCLDNTVYMYKVLHLNTCCLAILYSKTNMCIRWGLTKNPVWNPAYIITMHEYKKGTTCTCTCTIKHLLFGYVAQEETKPYVHCIVYM